MKVFNQTGLTSTRAFAYAGNGQSQPKTGDGFQSGPTSDPLLGQIKQLRSQGLSTKSTAGAAHGSMGKWLTRLSANIAVAGSSTGLLGGIGVMTYALRASCS